MEKDIFTQADDAYEEKKFSEAFSLFLQEAERGDVDAMGRIAVMYTCGEGVECDYEKALYWEIKAADLGSVSAMLNVAITYRIKGDIVKSKYWLEKAISEGDAEAALELAKLYMVSEKEVSKVKSLLQQALASGGLCEDSIAEAKELLRP